MEAQATFDRKVAELEQETEALTGGLIATIIAALAAIGGLILKWLAVMEKMAELRRQGIALPQDTREDYSLERRA